MYIVTGVGGQLNGKAADEILDLVPADQLIFTASDISHIAPQRLEKWRDLGVTIRRANYDDPAGMVGAFKGAERLLLVPTWSIGATRRKQHANAIDAAKAAGVKHIVYISFIGADIEKDTPPVASDHRFTEQKVIDSGLDWTFIRNSLYLDNWFQYFPPMAVVFGNKWHSNIGAVKGGFVAREDCARVAAALLAGKGKAKSVYTVTGPELISEKDIFDMICRATGWKAEYIPVTDEEYYAFLDSQHVPRTVTGDFSKSPIPLCSDDLVTNSASVRAGHFAFLTDTVEQLTGKKPLNVAEVFKVYADTLPRR